MVESCKIHFCRFEINFRNQLGPPQVKCRLLISGIFWKFYKLNSSIFEKCWKFIASKMLEIKSQPMT